MTSPGLIFRLDRYIGIIKIIILTLLMNMLHFIPILEFRSCFSTNFTISRRLLDHIYCLETATDSFKSVEICQKTMSNLST